jgi:Tol biopolymer transport system component
MNWKYKFAAFGSIFIVTIVLVTGITVLMVGVQAEAPKKQQIALYSDRDGDREIYRMDINGDNPQRLTNSPGIDSAPAWSFDGTKIAFMSKRDGNYEIYVMDADGGNQVNLTKNPDADDREPTWSPDGKSIAFQSKRDGNKREEIYVMDSNGLNPRNLTNEPNTRDKQPAWSLDGLKIVFVSQRDDGKTDEIYVMDAPDGENPTRLTSNGVPDHQPSWSGNDKIVFERNNNGVWIMDADGSDQRLAVNGQELDREPAASPDGKFVVFQAGRDCGGGCNNREAYRADITVPGGVVVRLTFGGGPHGSFSWFDPVFARRLAVSPANTSVTIWGRIKEIVGW